jgi:hypothetical protein
MEMIKWLRFRVILDYLCFDRKAVQFNLKK